MCGGVQKVVKHCSLRWKLDVFELCRPPLGELYTIVNQLWCVHIHIIYMYINILQSKYTEADLVLEEEPSKCPDGAEDKEQFVDLFTGVRRRVGGRQLCLQQVTECLDHAHFLDGSDHFELVGTVHVQEDGDIALKEDRQIGLFGLHFTFVDPALYIPGKTSCHVHVCASMKQHFNDIF